MFTIEHDFDATVVTLVDEVDEAGPELEAAVLQEDVIISAFEDCVTLRQFDSRTDREVVITLSMAQLRDLSMALDLPEGSYRLRRDEDVR